MKRFLVFALVLVFTGAAVFGADLGNGFTLGVEVNTGVRVATADDGNSDTDDTKVDLWNDDAALRARLALGYEDDLGGAKARFTLKGSGNKVKLGSTDYDVGTNLVYYDYAFGWVNLLDKKIVIYGGQIDGNLWGSGGVVDKNFDSGKAVRVALNVVPGLSFGFALPVPTDAAPIADVFGGLAFGAKYTAADMLGLSVSASMKLNPAIKDTVDPDKTVNKSWIQAALGFEIAPIDVLKINLSAYVDTAEDEAKKPGRDGKELTAGGAARIGPKVTFASNGLEVFGQADIRLLLADEPAEKLDGDAKPGPLEPKKDGDPDKFGVGFKVGASYQLGIAKPSLEISSANVLFLAGTKDTTTATINGGNWKVENDGAGLDVKVGVELALGTCTLNIFDKISGIGKFKAEEPAGLSDNLSVPNPIKNQFQINFKWAF